MSKLVDFSTGDTFENQGIPSKAFVEVAMKIGTDKAARIWVKTAPDTPGELPKISEFSAQTAIKAEALYGIEVRKIVEDGWRSVGIEGKL